MSQEEVDLKGTIERWEDSTIDQLEKFEMWKEVREMADNFDDSTTEATEYVFEPPSPEEKQKWFDETKSAEELRELADNTGENSFTIKAARTSYIEFRLEEPSGMCKACECSECSLEFYIPPFSTAVECPACHSPNVMSHRHIPEM